MDAGRRDFLKTGLWTISSLTLMPDARSVARAEPAPRDLAPGIHLFLDSDLVADQRNLRRVIHRSEAADDAPTFQSARRPGSTHQLGLRRSRRRGLVSSMRMSRLAK